MPDDDAYERVTNPERFAPLHDDARQLVDELVHVFDVGIERDLGDTDPSDVVEVVRLVPADDSAAPLTFVLTGFPSVHVRAGLWHTWYYPDCGCDACDEDAAINAEEMRLDIGAVTRGAFSEEWDGERVHHSIERPDGSWSRGWSLATHLKGRYGEPSWIEWAPWPPRSAGRVR